ncbi:alpha/beta fold hydrolase [Nocardioides sp. MAH-18]|uniref:Alpha/beta fold hydrolase n=1 Tax=Nocardioides agri TaxID=2682843 RepID=A0A6L6XU42_9ACTN|nr:MULTISPECIES: alpha/beta hydrolase [unclassified Nocardioides]MBA2955442.1 alpha/beta fold hydrolase [Nocardioides sp. CGMCC 1.13656]MVQ50292.1 alpha/beta fold hydrolase [Nocardioides sp. MAH-18]
MNLRRAVALLVVLALVVGSALTVALVVAADHDGARDDVSDDRPAVGGPGATLETFYAQDLHWRDCDDAECGELTVPVDYRDPGGETIDLALLKVPAADPDARIGSLVVNPGGPGAPGTDYAGSAREVFRQPILDAYDIVGFDPRGTGHSAPVDCLADGELDDYIAQDPDPDTAAEAQTYAGWVKAFGVGCADRSGDVAAHVTTIETARDMDVLRAALGEDQLDYFGASYGTKLGATYADLFPDRVGRLVLDGAVDVSLSSRELSLQQAAGFETALRAYVQDCVDSGDCVLGDSLDEGLATIKQLLDDIDAEPLPTDDGDRVLAVGNAFYGVVLPLYVRDYWDLLTQGLTAALDGDGTLLLRYSDVYNSRGGGGYTDNSSEAIYAINCLDDPWAIPAREVPGQLPEFEAASATFGSVFAWGLTSCGGIQVQSSEPARDIRAAGAAPIVVVGTTRDPATPYAWAVALADQLESGVLVSRDGDGHTGYNSGNECVDTAVEDYLVEGTVPEDGLSC